VTKPKRSLSRDEHDLWRRVAATVKPRPKRKSVGEISSDAGSEPAPKARKRAPALPAANQAAQAPRAITAPAPQSRANEKRVRRGKIDVGGVLDLHGHTQASGHAALARFLKAAQARGEIAVIVITGVGRAGEGVLKRRVPEWIAEPALRMVVSGYAPAHRSHGGAGALYVFLRRCSETQR
jgi:DNA-nicking Smr family endonuclease